jgi:proteasome lid subunit RPN8/RPN11
MIEPVLEDIKQHVFDQGQMEACGLLNIERGRVKWHPCENRADDPFQDFMIDPADYKKIADRGDIVGVVHSHPNGTPAPSPVDRAACDRTGIPWYIFGENDEWMKVEPKEETYGLLGRPFVFGVYDCFTIIKDYYEDEGINIYPYEYSWEFWKDGRNLYIENYEKEGFSVVTDGSLQKHDLIFMALNSTIANHAGIYVGRGRMLHHAPNRLSCRDNYAGMWQQITRVVVRHEKFR